MITSIGQSIDALKEEYGLDRELVIEAMKDAVRAAARKQFRSEYKGGEGIQVDWDDEAGMVEISAQKTVVEEVESPTTELSLEEAIELTGDDEIELGDMLLLPLPTEELGRIAAQTAKQILMQKVREAIREKVYEEYVDRKGELVNGLVKRFERGDMIIDLGTNLEAVLPRREQSRGEIWNINERLRVVIADITKESRGQQVVVSRAHADLLKRLFEMEVPEIYDDTVVIKSAVREPGDRAKIAVSSNEKDVDPVGACVGMKGSRVQAIIKELRGEKIDIIEWSDEPSVFAANALSPAKVSQVRITDINERKMEVIVAEDQLSLAIGKHGQNVRLATRLVGWDIDIVSEEVLKKEVAKQMGEMMASGEAVPITVLEGVSATNADKLIEGGIGDIETLASTSVDSLVEVLDTSLDEAEKILDAAKEVLKLRIVEADEAEAEAEAAADTDADAEPTADISTEESEAGKPAESTEDAKAEPDSDKAETEETADSEEVVEAEAPTPEEAVTDEPEPSEAKVDDRDSAPEEAVAEDAEAEPTEKAEDEPTEKAEDAEAEVSEKPPEDAVIDDVKDKSTDPEAAKDEGKAPEKKVDSKEK